jgi:hypothetical protein
MPAIILAAAMLAAPESSVVERATADAKALTAREALIGELGAMGTMDRTMRQVFLDARKTATPDERTAMDQVWAAYYKPIDARHSARLKVLLDGRGWFTPQEVGARAAADAFLVASHSPDLELQKAVLAKMEPLVAAGQAPTGYANLYDRVAVQDGRPQRYATQMAGCVSGKHVLPADVEAPERLEQRRAALGLEPMVQYLAGLDAMYGRCDAPGR